MGKRKSRIKKRDYSVYASLATEILNEKPQKINQSIELLLSEL